jgi:5'-3' exonuclease
MPTAAEAREAKKSAKHRPRLFLIDSYAFIFRAYYARARSGKERSPSAIAFQRTGSLVGI